MDSEPPARAKAGKLGGGGKMAKLPRPAAENLNGDTAPPEGIWRQLTRREREVLRLFLERKNDKQIAQALGLRTQTVRNHISSIERKLGAQSRVEIAIIVLSEAQKKKSKPG
jgi:DNA-binding NarL/FixJ family response regulator